eukprot:gnl/MRDRNA2_/MRDRNA2_33090_c0_seq1.p1 gnl/MRDRNA2_/MRDRNA2_33090_c0~~gnl/MRDRNA2_/MRDRNA2_33090_c0_seq1.p1  ORF type:complete len:447 (-),score=85.93 gnl/MRDRNA2_/MRDRNA2_33090_c0_seq1:101-1267(-)
MHGHGWAFSTAADVAPPISMTTTFTCPEDGQGHVYSRISAPTRSRCEALLGAVEGTDSNPAQAVLYSSGLAACFAVLSRLLPRRIAIAGGYHGTHLVISQLQRLSGNVNFEPVTLPAPDGIASILSKGDVIWLETPINPTCDLHDIAAYAAAAKAVGGIHVVVDGTFAPPPLQRPLELGATVVLHATTKYLAGHSDVVGGALCVNSKELAEKLRQDRIALGSAPGNLESWLLMRSIRTVHLRVQHQSRTASHLASWLYDATISPAKQIAKYGSEHPLNGLVHAVHHPSLPSHPSHAVALKQMPGGFGGCFALELATEEAARALPGALTLFRNATSLGGVESLIEWRRKYDNAISPLLLRISIGLEEQSHLQADLEKGILKVSGRTSKI